MAANCTSHTQLQMTTRVTATISVASANKYNHTQLIATFEHREMTTHLVPTEESKVPKEERRFGDIPYVTCMIIIGMDR